MACFIGEVCVLNLDLDLHLEVQLGAKYNGLDSGYFLHSSTGVRVPYMKFPIKADASSTKLEHLSKHLIQTLAEHGVYVILSKATVHKTETGRSIQFTAIRL